MAAPGPVELGRGVVVGSGQSVPEPWAAAAVVTLDEEALRDPQAVVAELRTAWAQRQPVVIELGVDPARFRAPPSLEVEPWTLDPGLRLWEEELQFLVWANTYDARDGGDPTWWWARKAQRVGARPLRATAAGDVEIPGVGPVWVDGGPREPFPHLLDGLAVVHRESIERGQLTVASAVRPPGAELAGDQLRAVGHARGPARIIAPAGSGKTRVLTERLRHLVVDRGWERDAILAVAYNKKAQEELDLRCRDFGPKTRTLNSLGLWVLGQARGRTPQVLVERDVRRLVDRLAPSRRHRANTDPVGPYLEALSRVRLALVDPEEVEAERDDVPGLGVVFTGLRAEMAATGTVDFDEQIYAAIEVLLADGGLRSRLQLTCRHLLVDEFQDLTPAHVLLLRLLAGPVGDVFGVGDDDQVIYGHAGADPAFLIDYAALFPGAGDHPLEVNYRCPPDVVGAAASLLSYNHRRVAKTIRAARQSPAEAPALQVRRHGGGQGAAQVATQVGEWLSDGASPDQVAVLARVHSALLAPAVALGAAGVPVASTVRVDILERTGLRAALAYLRIATAPDERIAASDLIEILRRPSRGLPPWFSDRVRRRSRWSLDNLAGVASSLPEKDAAKVGRLVDDLVVLRAEADRRGATAAALLGVVRDQIGLGGAMGLLDASRGGEGSSHLDDLDALAEVAALHPDPGTLEEWVRSELERPADPAGVTLSTVHRVKGMEWDRVVVYGVTAGLLPHRLAEDDEEERRILHVAVTRARHAAVVLADAERPSPFLAELDGSAPHRPARTGPATPARGAASAGPASGGRGSSARRPSAGGPKPLEARVGLALTVPGGFSGTIGSTDADGALVSLDTGSSLRVRWGDTVSVHGRDALLVAPADLAPEAAAAEAALRAWRTGRARADKVAPFIVCSDRTLRAIATARPDTLVALRRIDGIGPTKLDQYGEEILSVLAAAADPAPAG
ncbi:ATP-dependent DNA helicase UvrD2 [Acidiferrimicrobium sp. IK]|uniref:ATP-dependent DNA helicase UvrD2 n=1 Tax=Acidiferrimicrobium sp. IK TaxID=2871700 RepID=UPI0021CB273D|nr:ATP-dependent DNA helicase UvrD2 [Acidiferrimicrobium sp. IK]MCU4184122.1 ATP-dependent DNA helicase UvrD2 [Acidiferrimicrobium sp. IK]